MKRIFPLAMAMAIAAATAAVAQPVAPNRFVPASGDWNVDPNWDVTFVPDPGLDDAAIIGSTTLGAALTADVTATGTISSPTVILGEANGTSGTLTIPAGSTFTTTVGLSDANFQVGLDGGTGTLNVDGTLVVAGQLESPTSSSSASEINLNGSASVTTGTAFFDQQLNVNSNTVSLNATGTNGDGNSIVFGLGGTHSWTIPASGAAVFSAVGNVDLGGTLVVDFPDGAPVVGSTFNLIDAASIDANDAIPSGFSFVDASAVGPLGPGERFAVRSVAGGVNGTLGQLVLEQQPVLIVDRQSGQVLLDNPGGVASIDIDAYAIGSQLGALNPANWNSVQDQSELGGGWFEANPSANLLSELEPQASGSISANTAINLGNAFALPAPTEFGVDNEDLTFQYAKPGGDFITGDIIYTGLPNSTLTLNVDPTTGEAQLVNGTSFTVDIDAYVVSSDSGSLDTANGQWNSLQDQGTSGGNWFEANSDSNQLSELLVDGGLQLAPNATVNLGFLFDETTGLEDLEFQFALIEEETSAAAGDFNADEVVSAADYAVFRAGASPNGLASSDYDVWAADFGNTGGGETTPGAPLLLTGKVLYSALVSPGAAPATAGVSVPEPTAVVMTLGGALGLSLRRRRNTAEKR